MRRRVGLSIFCGLLLPLAVAANASAQGSNMIVTPKTARAGDTVNIRTFNASFTGAADSSDVVIRDGTRWGRILRVTTSDLRNNINVDVPLPRDMRPGWHLLLAIQTIDSNGRQRQFLPGRTRLLVTPPAAGSTAVPGSPGGGGGLPDSPLVLLVMGSALLLLAAGAVLTTRGLRTLHRPTLGS